MAQSISNTLRITPNTLKGPSQAWKDYGSKFKLNETGMVTPKTAPQKQVQPPMVTGGSSGTGMVPNPTMTTTPDNKTGLVPPPAATQPPAPPAPPVQTPFAGLVTGIQNASTPNTTQTGLISDIRNTAAGNTTLSGKAEDIAGKYAPEIARIGQLGAGAIAGNLSTGSNVVGSGNAAIASQSASSRMQALSDAMNAELQGNAQQLTAQSQQATAQNMALGGANTQQQTQVSGIGSAAGFAQPAVAGYGQTTFDPLTGTYGGGSGDLNPQNVAAQLANEVRSGRMTYEQAVQSLGYAGNAGQQFLNNALGGGFNIPQSTATIQGQANVLGQLPQLEAADVAAEGIKNKITTYLDENPQINPAELNKLNFMTAWLEGKQLSDPKYQTFQNYLNEYTNSLAPILGVGGDPTNLKTEIAQSFINAAASGASIKEVLENMQGLSRGKLQDLRSGATGGGVVSNPSTGGGTGTGGLYDF